MILEGIVTTIDREGRLNIAPMGPRIEPSVARFVLRPFQTSTTYQNLKQHGEGVFHVTDDVLLFARAVIGAAIDARVRSAEYVNGKILADCCRYEEFRVLEVDETHDRAAFVVESVHSGRFRDFLGFNRAKNVVIEAAILASRADFLTAEELLGDLSKFRTIVSKTGGQDECSAFDLIDTHIKAQLDRRGLLRNEASP